MPKRLAMSAVLFVTISVVGCSGADEAVEPYETVDAACLAFMTAMSEFPDAGTSMTSQAINEFVDVASPAVESIQEIAQRAEETDAAVGKVMMAVADSLDGVVLAASTYADDPSDANYDSFEETVVEFGEAGQRFASANVC